MTTNFEKELDKFFYEHDRFLELLKKLSPKEVTPLDMFVSEDSFEYQLIKYQENECRT